MDDEKNVLRAWEAFIERGAVPRTVRAEVAASWVRSRQHQVTIDRGHAPLLTEAELFRHRSTQSALLEAARPVLTQARTLLSQADSMLILTDPSGLILETAGDPRTRDNGRGMHLERGGRWNEADIGTNAIGTAIASGQPVQIHASEHFCSDVQRWTCAAAPIHHPADGKLLGVLDVSGPARTFNPQSLAYAAAASRQIEDLLARAMIAERERLMLHFAGKRPGDDVMVLDSRGAIVFATEQARRELNRRDPGIAAGDNRRIVSLASIPLANWPDRLRQILPNTSTEIVRDQGQQLGAVLVLPRQRTTSSSAVAQLRHVERGVHFQDILGESPAIRDAIERARFIAESDAPVLLDGESGVGKELFARALHGAGNAAGGPFVPVNCGAIPRDLIGTELFGYADGAFTGARAKGHTGKIVAAHTGTLCLDEIGEMPQELQQYLLRIVEDGIVYPLASNEGRQVRVRYVSLTNRDLRQEIAAGRFRRDLYYRLAVLRLTIPPLRERGDDVVLLAEHFLNTIAAKQARTPPRLDPAVLDLFRRHAWPGNVRQLRNVIESMLVLSRGDRLGLENVPAELLDGDTEPARAKPVEAAFFPTSLKLSERATIQAVLAQCRGNLTEVAKQLGIARSTLYRRLEEHGLSGAH
jgi:sigma-54 dependent transcriptional regulator, acetoin dehydrogenase operon transcriptional activator AcoR